MAILGGDWLQIGANQSVYRCLEGVPVSGLLTAKGRNADSSCYVLALTISNSTLFLVQHSAINCIANSTNTYFIPSYKATPCTLQPCYNTGGWGPLTRTAYKWSALYKTSIPPKYLGNPPNPLRYSVSDWCRLFDYLPLSSIPWPLSLSGYSSRMTRYERIDYKATCCTTHWCLTCMRSDQVIYKKRTGEKNHGETWLRSAPNSATTGGWAP